MAEIHDIVTLIPWQESWEKEFHLEKQRITGALMCRDHYAEVIHVGSTSVKGMISKPIIDILVCPDENVSLEAVIPDLEQIGYINLGECGRPGRYFLSCGDKPNETFYLHLCHKSHPVAQTQLLFQKIIRSNPAVFHGYLKMKRLLASEFLDDRQMYREIKGTYIESVLGVYQSLSESPKLLEGVGATLINAVRRQEINSFCNLF